MQLHSLQLKNKRKKRKTIGRGGKKGTYSGKGNKGQKARSGGNINPLFEGGRSTLVDHMKKLRGFKSKSIKKNNLNLTDLDKKFKNGDIINEKTLLAANLIKKQLIGNGIKILGDGTITKKLTISKTILLSKSAANSIKKANGEIEAS
jgi:large subunit ribosomal protein L15